MWHSILDMLGIKRFQVQRRLALNGDNGCWEECMFVENGEWGQNRSVVISQEMPKKPACYCEPRCSYIIVSPFALVVAETRRDLRGSCENVAPLTLSQGHGVLCCLKYIDLGSLRWPLHMQCLAPHFSAVMPNRHWGKKCLSHFCCVVHEGLIIGGWKERLFFWKWTQLTC